MYISKNNPTIKGFNRRGLYRMKQFYELYKDDELVTPLVTQISWTNHLIIMSGCKTKEERLFYIKLCIKENYSKRELERQIDSAYYQRYLLSVNKPLPEVVPNVVKGNILDTYVLEFLDLPEQYTENVFFYKVYQDKTLVGTIHFEKNGNIIYMDILIFPEFQKNGLGTKVIGDIKNDIFNLGFKKIEVFIDESNIPSLRLFGKSGFKFVSQENELKK